MRCRIFLLIGFAWVSFMASAQPVSLTDDGRVEINGRMSYFRDETQQLKFDDFPCYHAVTSRFNCQFCSAETMMRFWTGFWHFMACDHSLGV